MKESKWNVFLDVRLKTHQKRVIYYEKGYIKMKRENINPNNSITYLKMRLFQLK